MSSVTRFLTQVNPSASIFNAGNALANPATAAYEFVPASGNTVGNYPPGYVQLVPVSVAALLASAASAGAVLRDMGKTIYAGVSVNSGTSFTGYGRFRQVQVLVPQVGNNNFVGGSGNLATGGVIGGPAIGDAYTHYMVIYIPAVNNGMIPAAMVPNPPAVLAGANQL